MSGAKLKRFRSAVESSRKAMEDFCRHRQSAVRQLVGARYNRQGSSVDSPINLMKLATSIYVQQFAARAPQVLCSTPNRDLRSVATSFQKVLNKRFHQMKIGNTFRQAVLEALYGPFGIVKIGEKVGGAVLIGRDWKRTTEPYADTVDLDDFVLDMGARKWSQVCFYGNRYLMPYEEFREDSRFKKKRDKVKPQEGDEFTRNESGQLRTATISRGKTGLEHYEEMVELWEFFLPDRGTVMTMAGDLDGEVLHEDEWEGPEGGPFRMLSFSEVPGQLVPMSPASIWLPLHEFANYLFIRCMEDARAYKKILLASGVAQEDAERLVEARHGSAIRSDNPQSAREFELGGIDQRTFAFMIQAKEFFTYLNGNLDTLGGLSANAPTATQDELVNSNASKQIQEMHNRVVEFDTDIARVIAEYVWNDPLLDEEIFFSSDKLPEITARYRFTAAQRRGQLADYEINVHPYSMQYETPAQQLQKLLQIVTQVVLPSMPLMQQAGSRVVFDPDAFMQTICELSNLDPLRHVLRITDEPAAPQGQAESAPRSPVTTRTNVRVNRPGAIQRQKSAALVQDLMGGRSQPAEEATIGRSTG